MKHRMSARGWRMWSAALLLACLGSASAAPPAPEQLLPATTTEFIGIPDVNRLADGWHKTQIARLLHDPAMKPFLTELFTRTPEINYLIEAVGSDFDRVKAAAGGEMSMSVVLAGPKEVAHVLTVDTAGRNTAAQQLINDVDQGLKKKGGAGGRRDLNGGMIAYVINVPGKGQYCLGLRDTLLIITDHLPTLIGMQQRWLGASNDTLANVPGFKAVRRKTQPQAGEREMIRFHFEPVARAEAHQVCVPGTKKVKGESTTQALRAEGVDGIKGVGGAIAFQSNGTDMLVRAATHCPQPFHGAMRMAKFDNNTPAVPDAWIPADVAGYITFGLDLVNAYDSFDTLFERLTQEPPGTFKDIMRRVRDDKDGPQVDIRKEIMEQLRPRVTLVNDSIRPIGPKCERYLVGIATVDAAAERILIEGVRKCFESDRRFKARDHAGVRIWEYQVKQKKKKNGAIQEAHVPGLCIAVARGHLFISSHGPLLEKALAQNGAGLGQTNDFKDLTNTLVRLGMGPSSSRSFLRLDAGVEPTYQMLRANQLDQVQSIYALLLDKWLADEKGKMRADVTKLPDYSAISKYLGLAGSFTTTDEDGWTAVGTVLKK